MGGWRGWALKGRMWLRVVLPGLRPGLKCIAPTGLEESLRSAFFDGFVKSPNKCCHIHHVVVNRLNVTIYSTLNFKFGLFTIPSFFKKRCDSYPTSDLFTFHLPFEFRIINIQFRNLYQGADVAVLFFSITNFGFLFFKIDGAKRFHKFSIFNIQFQCLHVTLTYMLRSTSVGKWST